ncbi:MAG: hypothetical protein U9Q98_03790 [Bacteroidota bacterium]|nr:hypothetical protein [Bacteroidota bacterium]
MENKYPYMELNINVKEGMALDDLPDYNTDSYIYVSASITPIIPGISGPKNTIDSKTIAFH